MIKLIMTNHHVQLVMLVSGGYCYAPLEQPLPATEKIIQKVSGISKKKFTKSNCNNIILFINLIIYFFIYLFETVTTDCKTAHCNSLAP